MPRDTNSYNGLIFNGFRREIDFVETKFMRFFGHFMPVIFDAIFSTMSHLENVIIEGARIGDLAVFEILCESCVAITEFETSWRPT